MIPKYDPCVNCKCPPQIRGACQGRPFYPGLCNLASYHWQAEADRQMNPYMQDIVGRSMHRASRNQNRHRGWRP